MNMDQWAPLAEGRTPRRYAPGQLIYLQGTPATEFSMRARRASTCSAFAWMIFSLAKIGSPPR